MISTIFLQTSLSTPTESSITRIESKQSEGNEGTSQVVHLHSRRASFSGSQGMSSTAVCLGPLTDSNFGLLTSTTMGDLHTLPKTTATREKQRCQNGHSSDIDAAASKVSHGEVDDRSSFSNLRTEEVLRGEWEVSYGVHCSSSEQLPTVTGQMEKNGEGKNGFTQGDNYILKRTNSVPRKLIQNSGYIKNWEQNLHGSSQCLSKTIFNSNNRTNKFQTVISDLSNNSNNSISGNIIAPNLISSSMTNIYRPPRKPPKLNEQCESVFAANYCVKLEENPQYGLPSTPIKSPNVKRKTSCNPIFPHILGNNSPVVSRHFSPQHKAYDTALFRSPLQQCHNIEMPQCTINSSLPLVTLNSSNGQSSITNSDLSKINTCCADYASTNKNKLIHNDQVSVHRNTNNTISCDKCLKRNNPVTGDVFPLKNNRYDIIPPPSQFKLHE